MINRRTFHIDNSLIDFKDSTAKLMVQHYLSTNLPSFHQVTSGRGFPDKRHNAHHAGDKYLGDNHDGDKHEEGGGGYGSEDSDEAMAIMMIRRRID